MIFSLNFLWVCVDWRKPNYNSRAHRNLSLHLLVLFRCSEMTYRSCCVQIQRERKITNKFGSFTCWKARLTRTGSFQGTSTFLACSAGVLLGRVNAKKLAIVHSTNQFSPMEKSKIAAIIFIKIILSTYPPKLRPLYRLVLSSPKPQLWDDHLIK